MSLSARMKYQFILGGWLCIAGVVDSFFQGPEALIATFFGLFPLIGGFRSRARIKREATAEKLPMSWD
jgi:hypothetical protein